MYTLYNVATSVLVALLYYPVVVLFMFVHEIMHLIALSLYMQSKNSLGLMWWLLCREVLRLRGTISRDLPWDVMPDLFFYRDPEEVGVCVCNRLAT